MEWISTAVGWIAGNVDVLLQVIGAFAAIATLTPNDSDDRIIKWILDAINTLGGNVGKAKNG